MPWSSDPLKASCRRRPGSRICFDRGIELHVEQHGLVGSNLNVRPLMNLLGLVLTLTFTSLFSRKLAHL
jgi:hypothetical protein